MTATLDPMSNVEFEAFAARSIDDFSADLARAASIPIEVARAKAAEQFTAMLPGGRTTSGHHFANVVVAGRRVGQLWIGPDPQVGDRAFVYDILIDLAERGQGFGRAAMLAAEDLARQNGLTAIGLSVFGHKPGPQRLYASLGYEIVTTSMLKKLDDRPLDSQAN